MYFPQLRCQRVVLDKLATGWVPFVPRNVVLLLYVGHRGPFGAVQAQGGDGERVAKCSLVEQCGSGSETEISHDEDADAKGSSRSERESDADSWCESDDESLCSDGPSVVNNSTGWYHKELPVAESALCLNGQCWVLACRF